MTESMIVVAVAIRCFCPAKHPPEEFVPGFLASLRNDRNLYLAGLKEEDRIGGISLGEDDLRFRVRMNAPAIADLGEKRFRIE